MISLDCGGAPPRQDWESIGVRNIVEFQEPTAITAAKHLAKSGGKEKIIIDRMSNLREEDCM
jgi:hypothetical protein